MVGPVDPTELQSYCLMHILRLVSTKFRYRAIYKSHLDSSCNATKNPYFYTIQQAALLLDVTTKKVHGLLRKDKLKARRDEEMGRWLLDVCSVHKRLGAFQADLQGSGASTVLVADTPRAKTRPFDLDLLILLIIGGVTLLTAAYTLVPLLF
jgi:hypothetical protein